MIYNLENKFKVTNLIGNEYLINNKGHVESIQFNSFQFIDQTDNKIANIANYAIELKEYNIDYINNKTKNIKQFTKNMIKDISISNINQLNLSFDEIYNSVIQMDICIGLGMNIY